MNSSNQTIAADRGTMDYAAASKYLGISKRKLTELATSGEIPSKKVGKARNGRRLFVPDKLDQWLAGDI